MTDLLVRAVAVGWDGEHFPGWLSVTVTDLEGRVHRVVEKAPVLTEGDVDARTVLPFDLWLRGEHVRIDGASVVVRLASGVVTTDGLDELAMSDADVRWL